MTVRPRELAWRGRIDAAAFLFPVRDGVITEAEARRRVVALWAPGTTVYALDGGDLLALLPAPARAVRAEESAGTPLVPVAGGLLAAAPVPPAEAEHLSARAGGQAIVAAALVRGGAWEVVTLDAAARRVEPAAWLDLGGITADEEVLSLGAPPAPVVDALPPGEFDPRAAYGKVASDGPPAALSELLAALKDGGTSAGARRAAVWDAVSAAMVRLLHGLSARMQPPVITQGSDGQVGAERPESSSSAGGATRSAAADPWAWLRWGAARLAGLAGFGGLIGRKQADYVRKMLEMFERGDLEQALRHAIPLGGDADDLLKRLPPSLFAPRPRADLSLTPGGTPSSSAIGFSGDLHDHLRALYRRAFERLEREGRIDEAAFVLAELLQDTEGAVDFLEKHGRLGLAADMAEARGLPPGWVVRLRFLAGDLDRALAYARRTGAWADAVAQLERRGPAQSEQAQRLRLEWAASLARAGEYARAVDVAFSVPEARALVLGWMGRVVAGGGVPAAKMAALRLARFPEGDPAWRAEALALLESEDAATAPEREAFVVGIAPPQDWRVPGAGPVRRTLARAAARTVARDIAAGHLPLSRKALYENLLALAADPALKTDAVPFADLIAAAPGDVRHRSLRDLPPAAVSPRVLSAADSGLVVVHDAARLPTGRTLVALGERGVRLVAADGRTLREWPTVPAHRLVPADSGNVAVALARRGDLWRLTRLDLITGAATPWCDAADIPVFAPDCDGSVWMVALPSGGETQALTALDLQGPPDRLASLWRLPLENGQFKAIARTPTACVALTANLYPEPAPEVGPRAFRAHGAWQRWRLEMPSLTMRERTVWESVTEVVDFYGLLPLRESVRAAVASLDDPATVLSVITAVGAWPGPITKRLELHLHRPRPQVPSPPIGLDEGREDRSIPADPVAGGAWLADIRYPDGEPPRLDLLSLSGVKAGVATGEMLRLRLVAESAENLGARLFAGHLTVWDDRGRVLAFDLDTGDVCTDLRLR
jgi:hypothetical protein